MSTVTLTEQEAYEIGAEAYTHVPSFPPSDFRDVVRPNFDTLYPIAWLDFTKEPSAVRRAQ